MTAPTAGPSGRTAAPRIRPAEPGDVDRLHAFVVELAEAEQFPGQVTARPEDLRAALFGGAPVAEAVVATVGEEAVGFALYYPSYSTVVGRPGLHLEDLYVQEEHRGSGVGLLLLRHLAGLAVQRGCARLEWWVLRTNDAAIRFYRRLHARGVDEIEVMRLDGAALQALGRGRPEG